MSHNSITRAATVLAAVAMPLLAAGCLERYLVIDSKPQGARVMLDGVAVGTTPVNNLPAPFTGHRRVVVELNGYRRVDRVEAITGPWYYCFPLDIFTELLNPFHTKVVHRLFYELVKAEPTDTDKLMARGEALKERATRLPSGKRAPFTPGEVTTITAETAIVGFIIASIVAL